MKRSKSIDLSGAFEQLTGLRLNTKAIEGELMELRHYSQFEVLWLLTREASQIIHSEHAQLLCDYPLSGNCLKAFRHVAGLRERAEKALQSRIDGWLANGNLPVVPVKTLASKPQPLPLKDALMPTTGYYLRACTTNQRPVQVVIGDRCQTLARGSQMTITTADIEAGVSASGEGQIVRWFRMPSPEPKTKRSDVFALPARMEKASRARDYAVVVVLVALALAMAAALNGADQILEVARQLLVRRLG